MSVELATAIDTPAPRPGWPEYFVGIARAVSARADCRRRQVGCVIADDTHRIVSTGYNGSPSGHPGCLEGACPRGLLSSRELAACSSYEVGPGRCISLHAEVNAVLYARRSLTGCVAYVTCRPCGGCAKTMAGAGLSTAFFPVSPEDWNSELHMIDLSDPAAVADPDLYSVRLPGER